MSQAAWSRLAPMSVAKNARLLSTVVNMATMTPIPKPASQKLRSLSTQAK